jgi:DNA-directed RNA polymerase specialized sigma24 family protein
MRVFLTKSNGNWFDPERGQFNPWIWTIAYRTLVTWARRPQPETTPFDDGHEPATPEPPPNGLPEDLEECGRRVLNKQEWTFIQLWEYGFGDMKQTEIAKVLGVGNARVAAIKERALAKLEDCMRQKGYA